MNIQEKLLEKFDESKLKWRVQAAGMTDGKPWVRIMPYMSARMVQERLDEVFGFDGWQTEFKDIGNGNVICKLSIWSEKRNCWVVKEDGTSEDKDSSFQGDTFKSAISSAFKRVAANGFGIGRYLYDIKPEYAECSLEKKAGYESQKTKNAVIYWKAKLSKTTTKTPPVIKNEPIETLSFHKIDGSTKSGIRQVYENGVYRDLTSDELPMNPGFLRTLMNEINKKYGDKASNMFQALLIKQKVEKLDQLPLKVFKELTSTHFDVELYTKVNKAI